MIHTLIMLAFWAVALPFAALVCFPWTFLTGKIGFLYRTGMWAAWTGCSSSWSQGRSGRPRQDRPRQDVHFHVEPCIEHRSADTVTAHSPAYFRNGQEGIVQLSVARKNDATGFVGAG